VTVPPLPVRIHGDALIVFVKEPRPGVVKTRLAAALGHEVAAQVYRVLAEEEIRRIASRGDEYTRLFFHAPAEAGAAMADWLPGEILVPQSEGDLGARMSAAFADVFARGARRAAIIGTDVPAMDRATVMEALESLDVHDLALGPTPDGGYYLLALDRPRPELFRGMAWSTPAVLMATAERAGALGLSVRMLPPLPDIDTIDDLRAEWPRLQGLFEPTGLAPILALALETGPLKRERIQE